MPNERLRLYLAGQRIGNYHLIDRISAGGMAEVYLARPCRDEPGTTADITSSPGHVVAIKVICPTNEIMRDSGITNIVQHFIGEGALLKTLRHPYILPVYESGVDRGYLYHVMEYVPTGSLADAISGRTTQALHLPLPLLEAMEIIRQVGSALQYIHERDIVHRDVKPGNLLVRIDEQSGRQMLLADFGVARWKVKTSGHEDEVTGTVAYMAPEVFTGWFSPASDQYSLAVMAFQLMTGHLPFEGSMDEQIAGHLGIIAPSVRMFVENLPWEVEEVVSRALEKRPSDRYPSVAAFVDGLEAVSSEAAGQAETEEDIPSLVSLAGVSRDTQELPPVPVPVSAAVPVVPAPPWERRPSYRMRALLTLVTAIALLVALIITLVATQGGSRLASRPISTSNRSQPGISQTAAANIPGHPAAVTKHKPAVTTPTETPAPAVALTDGASLVALSAPPTVSVGRLFSFRVTLANTGTSTWVDTDGYQLTCDMLRHPLQNCPSGFVATLGDYAVAPGGEVTFRISLTALARPGVYRAWINMAHSSTPFSTQDILVEVQTLADSIKHGPATEAPEPTAPSTPPTPVPSPSASPAPPATPSPTVVPIQTATPSPLPASTTTPDLSTPPPVPSPPAAPSPSPASY
jgi:serine/threonine protein kinase